MSSWQLFVYGTLRRGNDNRHARLLHRSAVFLGTARVRGQLYRVQWYPGLTLRKAEGEWVVGDLFRLRNPETLAELDRYEGSTEYQRVPTRAVMENGDEIRCWVYEFIGPVKEERRIASGDWMA